MKFIRYFCLNFRFIPDELSINVSKELNDFQLINYGYQKYKNGIIWVWGLQKNLKFEDYTTKEKKLEIAESIISNISLCIRFLKSYFSILTQIEIEATSLVNTFILIPENSKEKALLDDCLGLKTKKSLTMKEDFTFEFKDNELKLLVDRQDGIESLSEALHSGSDLAMYREYVRFFELAFGHAGKSLYKPLLRFLHNGPVNLTKSEVSNWFNNLRARAIHGDKKKPMSSLDIIQHTNNMKMAAYDVLFNKVEWKNSDMTRRKGIEFISGPNFITKGKDLKLKMMLMDDFGDLPINTDITMPETIEGHWNKTCD